MRKRWLCMMTGIFLLLTGCVGWTPEEKEPPHMALPDVRTGPQAPIGDSQSARQSSELLYLPDVGATRLIGTRQTIRIESGQTKPEACLKALLALLNESEFYSGRQPLDLAPVSNPVETTGELVTVNLNAAVWALDSRARFALQLAITNTLTELPGINYVNVLVLGRKAGLDLAGTLPAGALARQPSGDITTLWDQIEAQRDSADIGLRKVAALYYPSEDGGSLLGEPRTVTFASRDKVEYARVLLEQMAISAQTPGTRVVVPTSEWLERDPIFIQEEGATTGILEIDFTSYVDDFLLVNGTTRAMLLSSICYTMTSFIPQLEGVVTYIDGEPVYELTMMDGATWFSPNALMRREDVAAYAADTCTIYFPLVNGAGLYPVTRPIAQRLRTQPRALLRELMKPSLSPMLAPALPASVSDADILGLQILGDTALVNLSQAFANACRDMTETEERNMVYAMVNTLTEIDGVTRVRFYVDGESGTLAGYLFMEGEFLRNPGIVR